MSRDPASFDYFDPALQSDPIDFFAVLREQAPVYREPRTGAYFVTRAADLRAAAARPEVFSNEIDPAVFRVCQGLSLRERDPEVANMLESEAWLVPHTLLLTDPPAHGRYRRLAAAALSSVAVAGLDPFIRSQVRRYLTVFDSGSEQDFVAEFADKLPLSIILHLLGAPEADMPMVNRWAHMFFGTLMGQTSREEYLATVHAVGELYRYVARRIDAVRSRPDATLMSVLVNGQGASAEERLTLEELLSIFHVLLMAGHDTTRQSLANAIRVLATDKALYARLAADHTLVKPFIDEVLRLYSPANVTARRTRVETELGGTLIPAGSMVFMCWGSGNRDAAQWEAPDVFVCPRKGGATHLAFGFGIHLCVGMRLARAQLVATLAAFLERYAAIELTVPVSSLDYAPAISLRALERLPLRCLPRNWSDAGGVVYSAPTDRERSG